MNCASVIAAISTPPGKGGVAVIRVSGDGSAEIAAKVFFPMSGKPLGDIKPRTQVWGKILYRGEQIDDGMAVVFPAPHSYTGEETVEISCHGGILVTKTVLEAVLAAGAVLAGRGEFTRRAFLNGRLSLTEAESIGDLIDAESYGQIRLSSSESRGRLAEKIDGIRKNLVEVMSSVYARIDYPDEDLGDFTDEEMLAAMNKSRVEMESLLATYRTGSAIAQGIKTVIVGRPNVGKSSLYNLLCGEDAAIVTSIAGTTRDCLERNVTLGNLLLRLVDTAGVRRAEKADTIEKIGIEKTEEQIKNADLLLVIFDGSEPLTDEDFDLLDSLKSHTGAMIGICNKADRGNLLADSGKLKAAFDCIISLSAQKGGEEAIALLCSAVEAKFTNEEIHVGEDAILSSARQNAALTAAHSQLCSAIDALSSGIPIDAVSSEISLSLGCIGELDGRTVSEEVTNDIFSRFCVGK